jgi:hypothetical protein
LHVFHSHLTDDPNFSTARSRTASGNAAIVAQGYRAGQSLNSLVFRVLHINETTSLWGRNLPVQDKMKSSPRHARHASRNLPDKSLDKGSLNTTRPGCLLPVNPRTPRSRRKRSPPARDSIPVRSTA